MKTVAPIIFALAFALKASALTFTAAAGTYSGIFYETTNPAAARCGAVTLTVARNGACSGKLYCCGATCPIPTSRCDASGKVNTQTKAGSGPLFALDLQIDISNGTTITGTVSGANWNAPLRCTRVVFSKQNQTPLANRYTVMLSDGSNAADAPFGKGLLAITITNNGNVTVKGGLDDGTLITNTRPLCIGSDGTYAFYSAATKTNGASQAYNEVAIGWLNFAQETPDIAVGGQLWWACDDPTNTFSVPLQATGALYSETKPPPFWPSRDKVHVYLMMGQSNMAGHGRTSEVDKTPNLRVINFGLDNFWRPAVEPLQNAYHSVGPGLMFGKDMAGADPSVVIALVPTAADGSALKQWERGAKLYTNAVARAQLAMQWGTLKGFLWHQGENDSKDIGSASTYEMRLALMIYDIRNDLGVTNAPFVVGEIGQYLYRRNDFPYAPVVNKALDDMPNVLPLVGCASSRGLTPIADGIHFSADSEHTLGHEYATIMMALQAEAGN